MLSQDHLDPDLSEVPDAPGWIGLAWPAFVLAGLIAAVVGLFNS